MSRPASKFVKPVSEADREFLQRTLREHRTYTVRCRAHAILLSSRGFTVANLQQIFDISKPTALAWINRWEEAGRDGLDDKPRPGGPPSLSEKEQGNILVPLLEQFPRQPKMVIKAIEEQTGKAISDTTLRRMSRKQGFRWNRFRRSQRKEGDEKEFRLAIEEIELRAMPDFELAYFDEEGFSTQAVVPYGWQRVGERLEVPVGKKRDGVQVLGIQEEGSEIYGYWHKGSVTGNTVAEVLDDYSQRITRPTVLILDNASVHTCGLVQEQMDVWNDRGLLFYFLPPRGSELNCIERLWKQLKYWKLPIDCWEHFSSLVEELVKVFTDNGEAFLMPSLQSQ